MNSASRKLLIVEIRVVNETDFDPSQVVPITFYQDARNQYHSANDLKEIKRAMADAVVHFGNNFRHPLLFDVQVVPGDEVDAAIASVDSRQRKGRKRRVRRY